MSNSNNDTAIIIVVLQHIEKKHLPRVVEIEQKLNRGHTLNEFDIEYLSEALHDIGKLIPFLEKQPEYEALMAKIIHYYKRIADEALDNEKINIVYSHQGKKSP